MDGEGTKGNLYHVLLDKKQITDLIVYPLPYEQNQFILNKKLGNLFEMFVCNSLVKKPLHSPSLHDCERFNIFTQKTGFGKM